LFYVLRSRILYVAKHFGYGQALSTLIASVTVEVWVRLGWSLVSRSARNFLQTLQAYVLYIRELPALIRNMRN
jgi:hypothetical protein